jgi:hypothetical protein
MFASQTLRPETGSRTLVAAGSIKDNASSAIHPPGSGWSTRVSLAVAEPRVRLAAAKIQLRARWAPRPERADAVALTEILARVVMPTPRRRIVGARTNR